MGYVFVKVRYYTTLLLNLQNHFYGFYRILK